MSNLPTIDKLPPSDLDSLIIGFCNDSENIPCDNHDITNPMVALGRTNKKDAIRYADAISQFLNPSKTFILMEKGVFDHLNTIFKTDPRFSEYALYRHHFKNTGEHLVDMLTKLEYYNEGEISDYTLEESLPYTRWCFEFEEVAPKGHSLGNYIDRAIDSTRLYQVLDEHGIPITGTYFWTAEGTKMGELIPSILNSWTSLEDANAEIPKRHPQAEILD